MDDMTSKLEKCFATVFPDLPQSKIQAASQESVEGWDSVATVTLINVIEDEFAISMDLERLQEFSSFGAIQKHLREVAA